MVSSLTPTPWVSGARGESARAALSWGKCSVRLSVLILDSHFVLLIMKNSEARLLMNSGPTFGFKNRVRCLVNPSGFPEFTELQMNAF